MSEHHDNNTRHSHERKQRIRIKAKDTPGVICIERSIHDEAIVISGSLTVEYGTVNLNELIAGELEKAAQAIKELNGVVGHIKAAVSATTTDMISVTDEKAMVTRSQGNTARIAVAAIVFTIEAAEAERLIRKALAGVRAILREEKARESE